MAQSAPAGPKTPPETAAPAAELSVGDALILGAVEGITEYLPVSSTGHLIIASDALGLTSEQQLKDRNGQPLWHVKPSAKHPAGTPLTQKLAADTFTIVIQFGAIAAVALLYWRQLLSMINGVLGRDPAGLKLTVNLFVAFLPAAVIGLAIHNWIEEHLFSIGAVIAAQIVGAGLMLWAEHRRRRTAATAPVVTDLTVKQSLGIGFLQCLALWPGTSRSMVTIVGGYLAGLDPRRSAEFSFLLGFITLTAATIFKSYKSGGAMIQVFGWSHVLLGCVVAAITAALAVRFLVRWLTKHGLAAFAWYRVAFALLLALLTYA
ncbi:MAG: undecaprenyl-diphosphate phosphatase [Verrucomicrobia bacterium]|nr:undecaprenyl-diphosphate phosphatase [Verrucomicrobiota bacterium]